jgi:hypothetical protein
MNAHINTTTATGKAKRLNIASPALPAVPHIPAPTDQHLVGLIAAFKQAEQEHRDNFDTPVPDGGQAACMAAIGKMGEAMNSICAYRPKHDDRLAWAGFLQEQMARDYFDSEGRVEAAITALVENVASTPPTVAYDSRAMYSPEVQMSVLVRSFRDAAMLIDPTICGFWVSNAVDEDQGATSYHGITFDRRQSMDVLKQRADYLASGRLEQLDLSEVKLMDLIQLHHALDRYRVALDSFLTADVFFTHDAKGKANGFTWNGYMLEALREWAEPEAQRVIEAIRAYEPETAYMAYQRSLFLAWWEAEIGGELHDVLAIAAEGAAQQVKFGEAAGNAAADVMAEFAELDEAGQEALLAAARALVAQKKAA